MSPLNKTLASGMLVLSLGIPMYKANAADECSFQSKFDALRAIQVDGSRDYIEAIRAQLRVRKEILRAVIDCALKEVRQRQEDLTKLPPEFRESEAGKAIAKDLDASAAFYSDKRGYLDSLGIKGTQDLAREIAFWRSHNYKPITERQDNFALWADNQALFERTASRFTQMKPVVISVTLIDHEDVKDAWKEAEEKFKEAEEKNKAAKEALLNEPEKAPHLIKASLEPLSQIYKKFMEVSDSIKKIVPN